MRSLGYTIKLPEIAPIRTSEPLPGPCHKLLAELTVP